MPNTNGSFAGPKTAILYARVSTEEQKKGYSVRQQLEALRSWCEQKGYEVLEEVRDEGWSAAFMERPGLDRARDLVISKRPAIVVA